MNDGRTKGETFFYRGLAIPREPLPSNWRDLVPPPPDPKRKPISERDRAILAKREARKQRPITAAELLSGRRW